MQDRITPADMERYVLDHFDEAMERRFIKVYCQPVVRSISRQICGMEALARWQDPHLGLLTPDKFIAPLENARRIHELDTYIVAGVCDGYPALVDAGACVPISINLSRLDYELCDIFAAVESIVVSHRMPRSQLCIEITESVLNRNESLMRSYVERFRAAGYQVWMDDFGSGYSSLNQLKDFQFDELKIDMQFLSDFHDRSKTILASIVNMAKRIGTQTLTEGVETEEEFEFLRNIGCEKVQGSLFGSPIPYMDCPAYARARGLAWEKPVLRGYYDDLGRVNLLSAAPFQEDADPRDGRGLNSIPLAILEIRGEEVACLFTNLAFDAVASGVDLRVFFGQSEQVSAAASATEMGRLSVQFRRLLDAARSAAGVGRLHMVYNGEYYELLARRLAQHDNRTSVLVRMDNLSRGTELRRQTALDEGLRQIYSIFDWVALLDLRTGTVAPLNLDSRDRTLSLTGNLSDVLTHYAGEWIYPEDREKFLRFTDPATIRSRLDASGAGALTALLRARGYHGAFLWKSCLIVPIREETYYLMARDAESEVRDLMGPRDSRPVPSAPDPSALWDSAVQYCPVKFFWKDKNRRFCGASQSFLNFYGFPSRESILGKTDEDMGWHIHPDGYRDEELDVLEEGVISLGIPGACIARGESRSIVASKTPVYDAFGNIVGLFGYFEEAENPEDGSRAGREARRDPLTGLLNTRGLDEGLFAYQDEYELRRTDFQRIDVAIDDLPEINRRYGFDFGDNVIRAVSKALLRRCGSTATLGRLTGSQFTILRQLDGAVDTEELLRSIQSIALELREVDGVPFSLYLSVGAASYSETESPEALASLTQLRRMTADVENTPRRQWRDNADRIFYMYENLPMACMVCKLIPGEEGADDLLILYVNRRFARALDLLPMALMGESARQALPMLAEDRYAMARGAAMEERESCVNVHDEYLNRQMMITAAPVIRKGYCAFTYQFLD